MTDLAALDALIEAVTAGGAELGGKLLCALPNHYSAPVRLFALRAYNGSLNAAKALHEALLPGWAWTIQENGEQTVWPPNDLADDDWCADGVTVSHDVGEPARAWLLAILKAYRAGL